MHVLHVETGRQLLGGARQVLDLVGGLGTGRERHTLVCASDTAVAAAARESGLRTLELPVAGDADVRLLWRVASLVRRLRPDLVHIHSRRGADSWGLLAARLMSRPLVLTRRVDNPEPVLSRRWKYGLPDRIVAISAGVADQLRRDGVPAGKLRVVNSAVAVEACQPSWTDAAFREHFALTPTERPIAVIAQFIPRKGHEVLPEVLARVRAEVPGLRVMLFGSGQLESQLRNAFQRAGLMDILRFAGFRRDLREFLGRFELVLHPAFREGLGIALLESQAAGVPVVGWRVPGVDEAVEHGKTGMLVEPGDRSGLAAAAIRLLEDAPRRRELGVAGRKRVERMFNPDRMLRGNLDVYCEVLEARSNGS
ncbi:MAG: glycosyltransferase family 4 protein [Gammaproteobacteria bacterium]|nr:glycosyltransferase family 4 protein [Gammaproteobacteria bacterium]